MRGHSRVCARLGCSGSSFRSGFSSRFHSRFSSSSRNSCSATTVSHLATQRRHRALPAAPGDSVSREGTLELGSGSQGFLGMLPRIRFLPQPRPGPAAVRCPSLRAEDASPEPHLSMTGPARCGQSLSQRGERGIWGRGESEGCRRRGRPWDKSLGQIPVPSRAEHLPLPLLPWARERSPGSARGRGALPGLCGVRGCSAGCGASLRGAGLLCSSRSAA